jgi:hypothetical protein
MVRCDFSIRLMSQSIACEEPNGHLLDYWMKARFSKWNTGRLREAGRRLQIDADGATSQWGSKREKYCEGGGSIRYLHFEWRHSNTIRVILCFVKQGMCCYLVYRVVGKLWVDNIEGSWRKTGRSTIPVK